MELYLHHAAQIPNLTRAVLFCISTSLHVMTLVSAMLCLTSLGICFPSSKMQFNGLLGWILWPASPFPLHVSHTQRSCAHSYCNNSVSISFPALPGKESISSCHPELWSPEVLNKFLMNNIEIRKYGFKRSWLPFLMVTQAKGRRKGEKKSLHDREISGPKQ